MAVGTSSKNLRIKAIKYPTLSRQWLNILTIKKFLSEALDKAPLETKTKEPTTLWGLIGEYIGINKEKSPFLVEGKRMAKMISSFPDPNQRAVVARYLTENLFNCEPSTSLRTATIAFDRWSTRTVLNRISVEKGENVEDAYNLVLNAASKGVLVPLAANYLLQNELSWKNLSKLKVIIKEE